jgi:hypothetical protein
MGGRLGRRISADDTTVAASLPSTPFSTAQVVQAGTGVLNAWTYGAACDGVTNDAVAIQVALDALPATGGSLFIPGPCAIGTAGWTGINMTGKDHIRIFGLGHSAGFKVLAAPTQTTGDVGDVVVFKFTTCDDLQISGLTFDGNAVASNIAFFDSCDDLSIKNNRWRKTTGSGPAGFPSGDAVHLRSCNGADISGDNYFYRVFRGVAVNVNGHSFSTSTKIHGNRFTDLRFEAVSFLGSYDIDIGYNVIEYAGLGPEDVTAAPGTYAAYGIGEGPAIGGGTGHYHVLGRYAYNEKVNIHHNIIDHCAEYGIGIEGLRYMNDAAAEFDGPSIDVSISDNIIGNAGTNAILVTGVNGLKVTGNIIREYNVAAVLNTAGILVQTRGVHAAFAGESLVNRQLNGIYNATISGNVITNSSAAGASIWIGPTNVAGSLVGVDVSRNICHENTGVSAGILVMDDYLVSLIEPIKNLTINNNTIKGVIFKGVQSFTGVIEDSAITDNIVTGYTDSAIDWDHTLIGQHCVFGRNTGDPRVLLGDAAPTTGTWTRSDSIWNRLPTAAGTPGWVCVESGTFSAATDNTGDTDGLTGVITGMTDTSDFYLGQWATVSAGFPAVGPYRILAKTATSITVHTASDSAVNNITVSTTDPVFKAMAILGA